MKTVENDGDIQAFLDKVEDPVKRKDCFDLLAIMQSLTGATPKMWGDSIIGFGRYDYKYSSGREGSWFYTGFSPRKQNLTIYFMSGFEPLEDHLKSLGKHKLGKSCLYVKKLEVIDHSVLEKMILDCVKYLVERQ